MTDTWGIPGPVFSGLHLGLLLAVALYGALRAWRVSRGDAGGAPERPEEFALLAGGRDRLGEFVVATLLERQFARLDGTGKLHRVRGTASDDLGRAALARIGKTGNSFGRVRDEVAQHASVAGLESGLAARGLLTDVRAVRLAWLTTAVAYGALAVLGVLRLFAGTAAGHPVGHLVLLLVGNAVALIVAAVGAANRPRVKLTAAGRAALEKVRRAGTFTAGAAGAVASQGLSAHPDKEVRLAVGRAVSRAAAQVYRRPRGRWAAAGGASAGYYGGSSCSGGSSCGGGGGGCGGGGGGGGGCGG
ncbi:TIGR04222 domain-containing membrane protein [Amycolatopsis sp. CA-128772]|uniref:TIGR04222 domain-containing membrane protein n=1 Tax=Amycolatopsis sp. CA-128772 TaxID=2073159 RepID=UPI000CD2BB96|nr:TIGR04222 domain-containing membrane protein [Amycolatopsis sp. CA-128772]